MTEQAKVEPGWYSVSLSGGIMVGALMITNCMGNVRDPDTGVTLEGARDENGRFIQFEDVMENYANSSPTKENTTIGIVADECRGSLTKNYSKSLNTGP